jgi:transposase
LKKDGWKVVAFSEKATTFHAEIARRLVVSRSAVSQWARQIKQRRRCLKSLERIKPKGRQAYLTDSQWQKVLRDLQRGAQAVNKHVKVTH